MRAGISPFTRVPGGAGEARGGQRGISREPVRGYAAERRTLSQPQIAISKEQNTAPLSLAQLPAGKLRRPLSVTGDCFERL